MNPKLIAALIVAAALPVAAQTATSPRNDANTAKAVAKDDTARAPTRATPPREAARVAKARNKGRKKAGGPKAVPTPKKAPAG